MNKYKIAFLIPSLGSGGAERVITTLANNLTENYEVIIITFDNKQPFYKLNSQIKHHSCTNLTDIPPSNNTYKALKFNIKLLLEINRISKDEKIDIIISFLTIANILGILVAKFRKIPIIISERNNPNKELISNFWMQIRRKTYPSANYIVVQTQEIADFYITKIKNDVVKIIPNPISPDLEIMNSKETKENIILNVGRLSNQKGQEMLLKAFTRIESNGWKLVIAGEGENRVKLEKLIKKLQISDRVLLPGRIKDVSKLYNKAKIFAFSSNYEGFPNALIEAMHFRLPCVSTNCPTGPSELIINDINGFLIPVNNEIVMAEKLNILINDSALRESLGSKAAKTVKKYAIESISDRWKKLIESCLNSNL
ncbi:GalNAc-alpha-(1-_4)-GalNAc-alpha-(1-_3)-diNAcBac-PP-undecaprenol alpha-1,4-N-acetyl-D-galactosaminyltransferase [Maribacter orientalis]|uniref:GalNAc-alpha-(1->4)-GalNAc-alpha-(1->3)-diNAcBac-PP-undecaprenol alpha-1,4-N-acetyl-D-galactosaminyltransferase n=1 Tax=Maribacter orientalis TaxID=228957 RepID=A0A1H7SIP6_9FLAO|nr:glycosyltransferase family 4 protein [Maribacter orientalis]SEL72016.1 GalNAc-alpha-(1->4)-GalNAc-alpha-(1->3)-diNAcBac-PP-undecaprenol alpha-1,4-N-acetyl-D-galactosaminyltransferase [Maribacter orientalis]